jgi:hypothetical protein
MLASGVPPHATTGVWVDDSPEAYWLVIYASEHADAASGKIYRDGFTVSPIPFLYINSRACNMLYNRTKRVATSWRKPKTASAVLGYHLPPQTVTKGTKKVLNIHSWTMTSYLMRKMKLNQEVSEIGTMWHDAVTSILCRVRKYGVGCYGVDRSQA